MNVRHWNYSLLLLLVSVCSAKAQTRSDFCHVYLIDQEAAQKALSRHPTGNQEEDARLMVAGVSILGRFSPKIGEEELTTKTFSLPGASQIITASVFYTDEMMFSSKLKTQDSMLIGIAVSKKAQPSAFSVPNSAAAEITYTSQADTVRVKTNIQASGRQYLVGLECRIQREFDETDPKKQKN